MEAAMTNHRSSHRSALASAHHTQFDLQISADNAPGPVLDGGKLNNFLLCYYQGCLLYLAASLVLMHLAWPDLAEVFRISK